MDIKNLCHPLRFLRQRQCFCIIRSSIWDCLFSKFVILYVFSQVATKSARWGAEGRYNGSIKKEKLSLTTSFGFTGKRSSIRDNWTSKKRDWSLKNHRRDTIALFFILPDGDRYHPRHTGDRFPLGWTTCLRFQSSPRPSHWDKNWNPSFREVIPTIAELLSFYASFNFEEEFISSEIKMQLPKRTCMKLQIF